MVGEVPDMDQLSAGQVKTCILPSGNCPAEVESVSMPGILQMHSPIM